MIRIKIRIMGMDVNWKQCVFVLFAFFCGYFFYFLLERRGGPVLP